MQTIDRIVTIMHSVAESRDGLTLTEVARVTGLPPATAHRLLSALQKRALVERDERSKRWRAGLGILRMAASMIPSVGFSALADPLLTELRDRWQECFYLSVLADGEVVCVRSVATIAPHRMSVHVPVGRRFPLHASAAAKAILSDLPLSETRQLLTARDAEPFTQHTIVDVDELLADLTYVRAAGYAVCDQEMELGVTALAVAIGGPPGEAPRSLGVIGPRERIRAYMLTGLLTDIVDAGSRLSGGPR
jgi:DNA-binding IclR family transcriptional regulator